MLIRDELLTLAVAKVDASPGPRIQSDRRVDRDPLTDSDLERRFLDLLDTGGYRLPDDAQVRVVDAGTKPPAPASPSDRHLNQPP